MILGFILLVAEILILESMEPKRKGGMVLKKTRHPLSPLPTYHERKRLWTRIQSFLGNAKRSLTS